MRAWDLARRVDPRPLPEVEAALAKLRDSAEPRIASARDTRSS
jgi:hypothetical protein